MNSSDSGQKQKSIFDSKMKDVVDNLRKGDSVIKSFTDKNRKKNVIKFIKSSN